MENVYVQRVEAVRELMRLRGWDAVVISGSDPHNSEYPAPRWKQVEWVSGFTGEAGDIVITLDHAGLWTDTRYFIQANKQLADTGIVLHKTRVPEQVLIPEWLAQQSFEVEEDKPITVALDGLSQSVAAVAAIKKAFIANGKKEYVASEENSAEDCFKIADVPDMLEPLWDERPFIPVTPIITLGEDLVGESREHKISKVRKFLMKNNLDAILLTALDEIAWTLNVRGSDIDYNPVVISYLLVSMDHVQWYVRKNRAVELDQDTEDSFYELKADGVEIMDYDEIEFTLCGLDNDEDIHRLFVDNGSLNYDLYKMLKENALETEVIEGHSPIGLFKAIKNETEIQGMKEAHLADGVAMEKFLYWLEVNVTEGSEETSIDEWDAARKLDSLRAEIPEYRGNSFETISAYEDNAALPHYVTPHHGSAALAPHGLYLVDSGGQYLIGTTDITRTVPLGPCTQIEMEDYTLVLKGMISLAMATFPTGTAGCQLDVLARNPLWQSKRNFGHGTGHGVGFFLCVHEGPQDIRQNFNSQPMMPGMITSDEPGIYREGQYGIRHENLVLCTATGINDFGSWLHFETLTLCHIDTSPVIKELLNESEIEWLNSYNNHVYETLSPKLPIEVANWLRGKTEAI